MYQRKFKIRLKINKQGNGGHTIHKNKNYLNDPLPGQIWTGRKRYKIHFIWIEKILIIHSILIKFINTLSFESGKEYLTEAKITSYEDIEKNFYPGAKFEIRIGQLYDNKNWATGEILEVLDENETNKLNQKDKM